MTFDEIIQEVEELAAGGESAVVLTFDTPLSKGDRAFITARLGSHFAKKGQTISVMMSGDPKVVYIHKYDRSD